MKHAVSSKIAGIIVSIVIISFFVTSTLFAQGQSYGVISRSLDGELKSKGADYGAYELGNKSVNRGALGGGYRGFEWVNSTKSPGKRGAFSAIDGEPDVGGSSKGNTFTTTALGDSIRVGQRYVGSYEVFKGFLSFDTTGIPVHNSYITSATLTFYGKAKHIDPGEENFEIEVYESIWTEPLFNPDWGAVKAPYKASLNTKDFKVGQTNTIILPPQQANLLIEKGDITRIALISSKTMEQDPPDGNEYIEIYSANAEDPNVRPKLDIQYNGDAPNIRPSLTWTGEHYFNMNGVYPEEISVGENNLVFRIQYTHPLNIAPLIARLWVDLNYDGDYDDDLDDPGEMVDMREADQLDTDYMNGKNYYVNVTLNSDGVKEIRYRFIFEVDDNIEAIGIPAQVATLSTIPAERENICFINTAEKTDSLSSILHFFEKRPLICSIFSSFANQKLILNIPF